MRSPGWGSYLVIGTPEQIAERMVHLSSIGLDGVVLSWVNYQEEMRYWNAEVMPLLEQMGLRKAVG
jgi:alkanesulfonate monooxygenase SsuD/methylene tetrahydromethanopterin reductase-like flavin-dependent oxidoreductase (luciferase family)